MIPPPISAPPNGGALNATHIEILRRRSAACGREIGKGMIPTPAAGGIFSRMNRSFSYAGWRKDTAMAAASFLKPSCGHVPPSVGLQQVWG
ncbi:MAG: hypothetical protein HYU33_03415 [Candidatus Omnitrophica bacterium]|nr:hypothetical protein [Candidatus Omnitrophota bacterium]